MHATHGRTRRAFVKDTAHPEGAWSQGRGTIVLTADRSYTSLVITVHQHGALKTSIRSTNDFWKCIRNSAPFDHQICVRTSRLL